MIMASPLSALSLCSAIKVEPEVHISTSYGKLAYDFSKNTQEITAISANLGRKERGLFASGLATIKIDKEYEVGVTSEPLSGGGYCVYPSIINVFIGFSQPKIYISKELTPQSCRYNLVMRHEQTHQRINKTTLDYFLPIFKSTIFEMSRKIKPVKIKNQEDLHRINEQISNDFAKDFEKISSVFQQELAVEQGKLDNRNNYSLEDDICKRFNNH